MYKYKGYDPPANGWKVELPKMEELDKAGRLYFPPDKKQRIQTKSYLDEVIELRTDPKYGKFFEHKPAKAKVKIARAKDEIAVEIEDFISPTILERLDQQAGLVKPTIDDWRAMVDCVMIDLAYDGEVFSIALSDVPERKTDLVKGSYTLPAPKGRTTVAVKIVDMLGEEVLATGEV